MSLSRRSPGPFDLPATLLIDVRLCCSGASVTLRGDVDLHTAGVLRHRLQEVLAQGEERVMVLLDEVTFMDSTGIGVLVGALKSQRAAGGELELVCAEPRVLRLLEVTGLDSVFTVHNGGQAASAGR